MKRSVAQWEDFLSFSYTTGFLVSNLHALFFPLWETVQSHKEGVFWEAKETV